MCSCQGHSLVFLCFHCGFSFFIFPFAKKELESACNCETDFALPKRLFIGKAGWLAAVAIIFQCCCPLWSQGVQPIRVTKGQAHLECCLHSGIPSFVRHHPWIVSHTLEITRPRPVQSVFQPTYNTRYAKNAVRSILKWGRQKSSWIDFSSCTVTLIKASHTLLLYSLPLFGCIVTEIMLLF